MLEDEKQKKWVYQFGQSKVGMHDLLGQKGYSIAKLMNAGLPVPPGFTITTEACFAYKVHKQFPEDIWKQVLSALEIIEQQAGKGFGRKDNPLFLAIRYDAKWGGTIFNLGINDETAQGLLGLIGDERFVYTSYCNFIQQFSSIVFGRNLDEFWDIYRRYAKNVVGLEGFGTGTIVMSKDEISVTNLKRIVTSCKKVFKLKAGKPFPTDVYQQLQYVIEAIYSSNNEVGIIYYHNSKQIGYTRTTAINIQTMVFSNMSADSGVGTATTRDPETGKKEIYGRYLLNTQIRDLITDTRTFLRINSLNEDLPLTYQLLRKTAQNLELFYQNVQFFDFVIERGLLWLLRTWPAKLPANIKLKFALDLLDEGIISKKMAVLNLNPEDLRELLAPSLPPDSSQQPIAQGLGAVPGIAHGVAVFATDRVKAFRDIGQNVILIHSGGAFWEPDIPGLFLAQGAIVFDSRSHAIDASRAQGKPCIVSPSIRFDYNNNRLVTDSGMAVNEGDELTIDGTTGSIYKGIIPFTENSLQNNPNLLRYISLLQEINSDDCIEDDVGELWMLRDTLMKRWIPSTFVSRFPKYEQPFFYHRDEGNTTDYISFTQPSESHVHSILHEMHWSNQPGMESVVWSIMSQLRRLLQNEVGIGNHHLAIRPLTDPQRLFIDLQTQSIVEKYDEHSRQMSLVQLIGLELFSINHFLRNYLQWGNVQWWVAVQPMSIPVQRWWLDKSNPQGESLIPGAGELVGFVIVLDGRCLSEAETRIFYNEVRKREQVWDWYKDNDLSWLEVVDTLRSTLSGIQVDQAVQRKCQKIGLLTQDLQLSSTGASLLFEQTASERKSIIFSGKDQ
jgi:hypothetical protein